MKQIIRKILNRLSIGNRSGHLKRLQTPAWSANWNISATPVFQPVSVVKPPYQQSIPSNRFSNRRKKRRTDYLGLVGFHDVGFIIAKPAEPYAPWLLTRSQNLASRLGCRTNMAAGLVKALELLETAPRGVHRRIWLLSDGAPNVDTSLLPGILEACYASHINVNTIGFGDDFDERLLRDIAQATHNGKFVSVHNLRALTRVLTEIDNSNSDPSTRRFENTILAIDLSHSMIGPMEGRTKIEVVQEAIRYLIHYKQKLFS